MFPKIRMLQLLNPICLILVHHQMRRFVRFDETLAKVALLHGCFLRFK